MCKQTEYRYILVRDIDPMKYFVSVINNVHDVSGVLFKIKLLNEWKNVELFNIKANTNKQYVYMFGYDVCTPSRYFIFKYDFMGNLIFHKIITLETFKEAYEIIVSQYFDGGIYMGYNKNFIIFDNDGNIVRSNI